jgi:hypothetical protein
MEGQEFFGSTAVHQRSMFKIPCYMYIVCTIQKKLTRTNKLMVRDGAREGRHGACAIVS